MIEDFESANDCPACGSKSRTISVKLDNRSYYKTVCGNRRCHLEDIPGAYLYPDKHASVEFWNNFTDDWTP